MPAASILIKPASSNCNIDCTYCFYKCLSSNREQYSLGFMKDDILEKLVIQAFEYADYHVTFAFQGGEPTLAGLPFFRRVLELQQKYNTKGIEVENTIQTNGLLIDREWAQFLAENHILAGVSLDGPKKLHDRYRKDAKGAPTFDRVMQTISLFHEYRVDYNILSVITAETCEKASYLYNFYQRNHFSYVQLIPCMDERGRNTGMDGASDFRVTPEKYGKFLCELFDLWYEEFMQSQNAMTRSYGQQIQPMDIRMFSNLAQMAAGYPAEECGMNGHCTCYFVVEGDGSVYPCDFYCLDEWKLGTVENSFGDMIRSDRALQFVEQSHPVAARCRSCAYYTLCRGGCRRWREGADGGVSLNALCPAYEMFFAHTEERIQELGKIILRRYGAYRK